MCQGELEEEVNGLCRRRLYVVGISLLCLFQLYRFQPFVPFQGVEAEQVLSVAYLYGHGGELVVVGVAAEGVEESKSCGGIERTAESLYVLRHSHRSLTVEHLLFAIGVAVFFAYVSLHHVLLVLQWSRFERYLRFAAGLPSEEGKAVGVEHAAVFLCRERAVGGKCHGTVKVERDLALCRCR